MKSDPSNVSKWGLRAGLFLLFLALGLLVFFVFSHFRPVLPAKQDHIGRLALVLGCLAAALLVRNIPRISAYWRIPFAFFIAALATAADYTLPTRELLLQALNIPLKTPAGIALDKLDSSLIIVVVILLLSLVSGRSLGSLYLKKGNLRQGLTVGLIAFGVAALGSIPFSQWLFGARDLTLSRVLAWTPWILVYVFGNAFNEELLFRGMFLGEYEPLLGRFLSNLVIAIPFTLHHTGVPYTLDGLLFLAFVLPLALVWGWLTQKTGSLWGSVLFHAGTDIPIVLSIFSNL